jgi:hypothetical protein
MKMSGSMRKSYPVILGFIAFIFPCALYAQDVQVLDWGIEKYCSSNNGLVRVLVEINNAGPKDETYEIRINNPEAADPVVSGTGEITVAARTVKREEIAVPSEYIREHYDGWKSELEISKSDGTVVKKIAFPELTPTKQLIAIYASNDAVYRDLQNRMRNSGSIEDQADKSRNLSFIQPRHLPRHWWAYGSVHMILIARPIDSFTSAELEAIEGFARTGGHLVLIESELHNNAFLANYREKAPDGSVQELGNGILTRLGSLKEVERQYVKYENILKMDIPQIYLGHDHFQYMQHTLGTIYSFPKLPWLIAVLVFFLIIAGPINFMILRRIQKREWGWITVPAISIVLASALFSFALARRPPRASLDEFSYAEMDGRGNKAMLTTRVRVSSPVRMTFQIHPPINAAFHSGREAEKGGDMIPAYNSSDPIYAQKFWPAIQWQCSLRNLSFAEAGFGVLKDFPGNVVRTGPAGLRNESGISFDAALFITSQQLYQLGAFQNAATKDLTPIDSSLLSSHFRFGSDWYIDENGIKQKGPSGGVPSFFWEKSLSQPFSIARLVELTSEETWQKYFEKYSALFIGISQSDPTIRIDNCKAAGQHKTVTVIRYH